MSRTSELVAKLVAQNVKDATFIYNTVIDGYKEEIKTLKDENAALRRIINNYRTHYRTIENRRDWEEL